MGPAYFFIKGKLSIRPIFHFGGGGGLPGGVLKTSKQKLNCLVDFNCCLNAALLYLMNVRQFTFIFSVNKVLSPSHHPSY